jgi:hypothetical protein
MVGQPFTQERLSQHLLNLVILSDQPFGFVESRVFQQYFIFLKPDMKLPNRSMVKERGQVGLVSCLKLSFSKERQLQIARLSSIDSKISLSTDIWTAPHSKPYLAITFRYVSEDFNLNQA